MESGVCFIVFRARGSWFRRGIGRSQSRILSPGAPARPDFAVLHALIPSQDDIYSLGNTLRPRICRQPSQSVVDASGFISSASSFSFCFKRSSAVRFKLFWATDVRLVRAPNRIRENVVGLPAPSEPRSPCPAGALVSFRCCAAVLGTLTVKPAATSEFSLDSGRPRSPRPGRAAR